MHRTYTLLQVEDLFLAARHTAVPASAYPDAKGDLNLDLIGMVKAQWEAKVRCLWCVSLIVCLCIGGGSVLSSV